MNKQIRKQVIIDEIHQWKESGLLPEHYCNYLLTLYTQGDYEAVNEKQHLPSRRFKIIMLIPILLFLPILLLVIYFTEMSFVLQMVLCIIFLAINVIIFLKLSHHIVFAHVTLLMGAITILFISYEMVNHYVNVTNKLLLLRVVLLINCLLWLGIGKKMKLMYFTIASLVGIGLIFISFFYFGTI
ncbi:hypothetical protein FZC66_01930 [Priestia megaterium]|nr:hypothetical protein FZC66_01930 [Priestia megaterium]